MLMEKKSKIFLIVIISFLILSIGITFQRYVVFRDYFVQMSVHCNPFQESCFVYTCDEDSQECLENGEGNVWYYKLLTKKAYTLPDCNKEESVCRNLSCEEGEKNCVEIECNPSEVEEGISCFTVENSDM
ncbi:MAG: hypothetical protein EOM19_00055 [Candidatus Moranbacteria bacterium]|nr:hypothetical protein [Candidatus Moranbacteria bacterium]